MSEPVLKHRRATFERIEKFISDIYFTDVNIRGRIDTKVTDCRLYRSNYSSSSISDFAKIKSGGFSEISTGARFFPLWSQHWVRVSVPDLSSYHNVHLAWDVDGAESLVCDGNGSPIQGLSCKRREMKLPDGCGELFIQVSCTGLFGAGNNGMINPPDESKKYTLSKAHFFARDSLKHDVFMDLSVLFDICKSTEKESSVNYDALYAGNEIINTIVRGDHSTAAYRRARELGMAFFSSAVPSSSRDTVHVMGHCHIDSAWLWPWRETVRKVARSWSTTLRLFEDGAKFNFAGSQVAQYAWLKEQYPACYEKLKRAVKRGEFCPVGGTWVEMDTNIPNAESMIRQFLYGQQFYRREFGVHSDILWLPDTFGYSGQLPQIMRLCGVSRFLSQKLSWNLTNTFPHHSFTWQGIDRSSVLAHFPPGDTYESDVNLRDLLKSVTNNKDKGKTHDQMLLFGYGDGGGGPTLDMVERLGRLERVPGLPRITRSSPEQFFTVLERSQGELCKWWGELYFELHRGTYTTHAQLKERNRRCEMQMMLLEFLGTAWSGFDRERAEELWKIVLFNQFHDIIPGSSIHQVFVDAMADYDRFSDLYTREIERFAASFAGECVVNQFGWARSEVVTRGVDGPLQLHTLPALYIGAPRPALPSAPVSLSETKRGYLLRNSLLSAEVSHTGELISVRSAGGRECLSGPANRFLIFDDVPLFWDAWDVMEYHVETRQEFKPTSCKVLLEDRLRCTLEIVVPLLTHGHVTCHVTMDADTPFLSFTAQVDWRARHKFLKVEFPFSVSAEQAQYEIQSGMVSRPTHGNTSWDSAKFEVSGHKWAYLGEPDFGVGLLSGSKYGYSSRHNALTMSLLRSPTAPDGSADIGSHVIRYGLYPVEGPLYSSRLVQVAHNFNSPLTILSGAGRGSLPTSVVEGFGGDGVTVQSIKQAEDGKGTIVRAYEPYGKHASASVTCRNASRAFTLDAVESERSKRECGAGDSVELTFRPFEIKTVYFEQEPTSGHSRRVSDTVSTPSPAKKFRRN